MSSWAVPSSSVDPCADPEWATLLIHLQRRDNRRRSSPRRRTRASPWWTSQLLPFLHHLLLLLTLACTRIYRVHSTELDDESLGEFEEQTVQECFHCPWDSPYPHRPALEVVAGDGAFHSRPHLHRGSFVASSVVADRNHSLAYDHCHLLQASSDPRTCSSCSAGDHRSCVVHRLASCDHHPRQMTCDHHKWVDACPLAVASPFVDRSHNRPRRLVQQLPVLSWAAAAAVPQDSPPRTASARGVVDVDVACGDALAPLRSSNHPRTRHRSTRLVDASCGKDDGDDLHRLPSAVVPA